MSGGGGAAEQQSQTQMPEYMRDASKAAVQFSERIAQRGYRGYGGQTVAGLTPDQLAAFEMLRQMPGAQGQIQGAANKVANLPQTAAAFFDPYAAAVEAAAVGNVNREGQLALNNLRAQSRNVGAFGGSRQGVLEGTQMAETARRAGELSNEIRSQAYNTSMQQALNAAQLESQLAAAAQQAGIGQAEVLGRSGAAQQTQAQTQLNDQYRRWLEEWNYPLEQLKIRLSGVSGVPFGQTSTSGLLGGGKTGGWGSAAAGAAGGAATGAAIGSVFPGYGTAIGAGVGALAGGLGGYYGM